MATNVYIPKNKGRALTKALMYIGKSTTLDEVGFKNIGHANSRVWWASTTPTAVSAQYSTSPYDQMRIGDLAFDTTNKLSYVVTVDLASDTDATFTSISID